MEILIFCSCKKEDCCNSSNQTNNTSQFKYKVWMNYVGIDSLTSNAPVLDSSKWHYVAVTVASDRRSCIYIDGIKQIDSYRENNNYLYSNLYLAASYYTSVSLFYKGFIDELKVSNIVKSQMQILNYYSQATSNASQVLDVNTIGLWHFDEALGSTSFINSANVSNNGLTVGNCSFMQGKAGNAIYFDGVSGYANCNMGIPNSNFTIEFWFKTNTTARSTMIQPYGMYSSNIAIAPY